MLTLALVGLIAAAAWFVGLLIWPFAPCRRCEGSGTNLGSNRKRFGNCRKCGGTRRRLRVGARAARRMIGRPLR